MSVAGHLCGQKSQHRVRRRGLAGSASGLALSVGVGGSNWRALDQTLHLWRRGAMGLLWWPKAVKCLVSRGPSQTWYGTQYRYGRIVFSQLGRFVYVWRRVLWHGCMLAKYPTIDVSDGERTRSGRFSYLRPCAMVTRRPVGLRGTALEIRGVQPSKFGSLGWGDGIEVVRYSARRGTGCRGGGAGESSRRHQCGICDARQSYQDRRYSCKELDMRLPIAGRERREWTWESGARLWRPSYTVR